MAYPFVQMPTLDEFVDKALTLGCREHSFEGRVVGPRGPVRVRCLKGNRNIICVLPDIDGDERLTPTVLRSLCNRLAIDVSHFGLHLG